MSAPLTRWTSWLSLSDRGSRAIDQACRDWRHEVTAAGSAGGVVLAHARSIVGLGRLAVALLFEETAAAITSGWGWWMLGWIALPVLLNHGTSWSRVSGMEALADYQAIRQLMPVCVFLALATGRRSSAPPFIGLITLLVAARVAIGRLAWPVVWGVMVRENETWWTTTFHGHPPGPWPWMSIVLGTLFPVALMLLANRVRLDRSRGRLVVASVVIWIGLLTAETITRVWYFSNSSPQGLTLFLWRYVFQLQNNVVFAPLVALALWALLVRRQERLKDSASTNLIGA